MDHAWPTKPVGLAGLLSRKAGTSKPPARRLPRLPPGPLGCSAIPLIRKVSRNRPRSPEEAERKGDERRGRVHPPSPPSARHKGEKPLSPTRTAAAAKRPIQPQTTTEKKKPKPARSPKEGATWTKPEFKRDRCRNRAVGVDRAERGAAARWRLGRPLPPRAARWSSSAPYWRAAGRGRRLRPGAAFCCGGGRRRARGLGRGGGGPRPPPARGSAQRRRRRPPRGASCGAGRVERAGAVTGMSDAEELRKGRRAVFSWR